MKMARTVPCCALLLISIAAVSGAIKPRPFGECLVNERFLSSSQVFPDAFYIEAPDRQETSNSVKLTVAQDFSVEYYETFKVVRNLPTNAHGSYVLYQCGLDRPTEDMLPEDLRNINFSKYFAIPLSRVSTPDTSAFGFLKQLGLENRISYTSQYTVGSCAAKLYAQGEGACNKLALSTSSPDFAAQASLDDIDAVFGYGDPSADNPKSIFFRATSDPGVLNRAEWLKFMAAFFNVEDHANALFNQISKDYNATKSTVETYVSRSSIKRPLVAWLYYQPSGGGGSSGVPTYENLVQLSFAEYEVQYMEDAGGRIYNLTALVEQYGSSQIVQSGQYLDFYNYSSTDSTVRETLAEILKDVDIIIDETSYEDIPSTPGNSNLKLQDVVDVYRFSPGSALAQSILNQTIPIVRLDATLNTGGYSNWFQGAVARPDVVLKEFAKAFHPEIPLSGVHFMYTYVMGAKEPTVLTAAGCSSNELKDCTFTSSLICPFLYLNCDGTVKIASSEQRCAPTAAECAKEGDDTFKLVIQFTLDGNKADEIVANDDSNNTASFFGRETLRVMTEKLNEGRNPSINGTAVAKMMGAAAVASRRALLNSHKTIQVQYSIILSGGSKNQAAKDVSQLKSSLSSSNGSVWTNLDSYQITSSIVTTEIGTNRGSSLLPQALGLALCFLAALAL